MAYLLGSIPFGFLLVWLVRKEDIRAKGSGNIGATNVLRSGAKRTGHPDFCARRQQRICRSGGGRMAGPRQGPSHTPPSRHPGRHCSSFWAICFPSGCASRAAKAWPLPLASSWLCVRLAALSALGLWLAVVALTRYVSLASILAAVVLPFLTLWLSPGRYGYVSGAVVFVCCWIVIVKHRQNIVRLVQGTEHGFGASRKTGA